ncbi:MAG TPA: hypothetical protein DEA08_02520 [Planctomycetes bacterium]|nr:hypothetical protein [Planctomycetota bacterium]
MRVWLLALFLSLTLGTLAEGQGFGVGYNQGWIDGSWGHDLTDRFDVSAWERVLRRTREGGGTVLRVWLLEGQAKEGVLWDGHAPLGVEPALLRNLRVLIALAEAEGVQLYWTLFDGNWQDHWAKGLDFDRHFNVLNDRYGHGALFRARVLGPILRVLNERPSVNYGFDLMNEVQGAIKAGCWPDRWRGARRFIELTTTFARGYVPTLRITASSGHHSASWDLLLGRFDGLGLDFYDVHAYTDSGRIKRGWFLARHARRRGLPIVLGEFGQKRRRLDPSLQAAVVRRATADAKRLGFAAALAWRLEDSQPHDLRFSFYDGDRPRPALNEMRAAAGLAPLPTAP